MSKINIRAADAVKQIPYNESLKVEKQLSKCIGIISYFPDDVDAREVRKKRCFELFDSLTKWFKLPVILIAQNWTDEDYLELNKHITGYEVKINKYAKLGITKARITLRQKFIDDEFDYMIMLDDDSVIRTTKKGVKNYLKEIDSHPDMFGLFRFSFLRLAAISKSAYSKLGMDFVEKYPPEDTGCWEDHCFVHTFANLWPDKMFRFSRHDIEEVSEYSQHDDYSCWYNGQDQTTMAKNSAKIVYLWTACELLRQKKNG